MRNLFELVREHASAAPSRVAIAAKPGGAGFAETTYATLAAEAERFAALYQDRQSPERSMVPLLVGKSPAAIACALGAIAADRPFCFLNGRYRGPQIGAALEASGARFCVVDGPGLVALRGAWHEHAAIGRTTWLVVDAPLSGLYAQAAEQLQVAAEVIFVDRDLAGAGGPVRPMAPRSDVVGAGLFTSGSSGEPKGVLVSEADLMARTAAEIEWFGLGADDVLLSILPFSFDVGLNQLFTALAVGGELVLAESWLPADLASAVELRRVTGVSGVPAIWQDLIQSGVRLDRGGRHASLRYVTISGGNLPVELLERLPAAVGGAAIFKTYGQSEAFRSTSLRPDEYARRPDSVGRAIPGVRVYVVREDGSRCATGEVGEVVHSGPGTMLGYLNPDANEVSLRLRANPFNGPDDPARQAVFTGDLGYFDDEGFLYLKGRRDGMLKIMGNRVYPQEVTHQILRVAGVLDAVVAGVGKESDKPALVAFVVVEPTGGLSAASLRAALTTKLPAYMIPRDIVLVRDIPRTATGKPDQRRLVDDFFAGAVAEVSAEPSPEALSQ